MKLNPYPKYKDSGIKWIGEIPEAWGVRKIKQFSRIVTGSTPGSGNDTYWDGNINWITPADLSQRKKYSPDSKRKITKEGYDSCGTTYVYGGSIILATRAPIGYATIVKEKLCFNQGCKAFKIDMQKIVPDYIYYFLNAHEDVLISLGNVTTFGELSTYNLASFLISLPPKKEQQKISSFLDKKNLEINNTIQKDKQLIEILKEKRTALINHVVTKGLDPNAKIKDSGIQWIGDIPEDWEVVPLLKLLDSKVDYRGATPEKVDDGVFLVTARNIKEGKIDYAISQEFVPKDQYNEIMHRGLPRKGDLLFTTEAPLGEVANVDNTNIALAQRIIKMAGRKAKLDNYYLKYFMMTALFQGHLQSHATGSTALGIKASNMCYLRLIIPPFKDQLQIVKYLDKQTLKIDKTIQKIEKKIEFLEEYKKSLIHYVITGKIDVRSVAA